MGAIVTFDDRTIPAGSPLCYSYWIKALDLSQNRSGASAGAGSRHRKDRVPTSA